QLARNRVEDDFIDPANLGPVSPEYPSFQCNVHRYLLGIGAAKGVPVLPQQNQAVEDTHRSGFNPPSGSQFAVGDPSTSGRLSVQCNAGGLAKNCSSGGHQNHGGMSWIIFSNCLCLGAHTSSSASQSLGIARMNIPYMLGTMFNL